MLKQLLHRVTFEVVGVVALAVAVGVAVVSAASGLYAALRTSLSAAASAGVTSLAAALLAGVLALVLVQLAKARSKAQPAKARRLDPDTIQQALTVGSALTGLLADVILERRLDHRRDKHGRRGHSKRR